MNYGHKENMLFLKHLVEFSGIWGRRLVTPTVQFHDVAKKSIKSTNHGQSS